MRPAARLSRGLLIVATVGACASSRPASSKADVPTSPTEAPVAVPSEAPPSAPAFTPPPSQPGGLWGGARSPGPFNPAGGLPIVGPGQSRTETEGCLALANPETEGPTQAPAVENSRALGGMGGDGPEVSLKIGPAGIVLTHGLFHNCCQKAAVETKVDGDKVLVTETFTGETCRCNCRSTLRTTVGLKPGMYAVEVVRVDNGPPKSIFAGNATIQSLMVPKPH